MKILVCSDSYGKVSGIARYVKEISKILKKNHKIEIVCEWYGKEGRAEKDEGVKVTRLEKKEIEGFMERNKDRFDIVITGWYPFLLPAIDNFDKVIYVLPSVRKISYSFFEGNEKMNINTKEKARKIIKKEKEGMKRCDKIIYPSEAVKEQVKEEYGVDKGKVIPLGVNLEEFKPGKNKKHDVLTVANFDPRKGIDKLIKAANFSKANFAILGDGPMKEDYKKMIEKYSLSDRVKLLGRKESSKYYPKSKIYCLPSRYEAFGLILLEAMACGLPCIAFRPDGNEIITASDEIIKDGETGFLVEDEKEMGEKIDFLLDNEDKREEMGKRAREEAKKYSWKNYVNKLAEYIPN